MPRIRKKTSKRGTTNQREKIKQKATETRKKKKKEVKKKTQWKTKHPKDPGIPNNFPYKDQILAEVAEERRRAAEEKERRKAEKKAAKAKTSSEDGLDAESEPVFDGVSGVSGRAAKKASEKEKPAQVDAQDAEEEVSVLINRDLPHLKSVLDIADVVLQVLDARDPLPYRSSHIDELASKKKTLLVLNKVDTCPREAVMSWTASLRIAHPTVLFCSASAFLPSASESSGKGRGKERADDAWGVDSVLSCLKTWAEQKTDGEPLVVAVVGIANAGKSSLINSLLRKATFVTYAVSSTGVEGSTTTMHTQEVTIETEGRHIRLVDTPGLSWHPITDDNEEAADEIRVRDILLRSRGKVERLKDPVPVVVEIVSRANHEDLMLFYNVPAFAESDTNAFLSGVARSNGLIKKGGVLDLAGAARIVLRDWRTGKLPRYTVPNCPVPAPASDAALTKIYAKDDQVLSRLSTRKDMRKASGVVKMKAGAIESRKVVLDESWINFDDEDGTKGDEEGEEGEESDEDISAFVGEEDEEKSDGEDDNDDEDDDEDADDESVSPSGKRKRGVTEVPTPPPRPAKKVAFSAEPKGTKQGRAAAGAKGSQAAALKSRLKITPKAATSVDRPGKAKAALQKPYRPDSSLKVANSASKNAVAHEGAEVYDFKQFF